MGVLLRQFASLISGNFQQTGTRFVLQMGPKSQKWDPLSCLPSAFLFGHLKRFRPCLHECLRCSARQQVPCRCCVYEHQRHDHAASEQVHHRILQSASGGGPISFGGHSGRTNSWLCISTARTSHGGPEPARGYEQVGDADFRAA
jgi:hypothetical protein